MNKLAFTAVLLALPAGLAGCDQKAQAPEAAASADAIGEMAMPAETKMARGTGTVTAVDADAGKVTLSHGPIAELQWPAMEMGFAVEQDMLSGIAIGDDVVFDLRWDGKAAEITQMSKAKQ